MAKLPVIHLDLPVAKVDKDAPGGLSLYEDNTAAAAAAALKNANGLSKVCALTELSELFRVALRAEKTISALPCKLRVGSQATFNTGGTERNRRARKPSRGTAVMLVRTSETWRLVNIQAIDVWPGDPERFYVGITVSAREWLMNEAVRDFYLIPKG